MENKKSGYGKEGRLIGKQFKLASKLAKAEDEDKNKKASKLRKRLNKIGQKLSMYEDE
jgi:hypothetical protein